MILDECNSDREGLKRIGKNQMHFVNFDICLDGKWEPKSCDKGSLFWVITNCCIPIEKYPTFDECLSMEDGRNQNNITKASEEEQGETKTFESTVEKDNDPDIDQDNLSTIEEELPESEEPNGSFSADTDKVAGYRQKEDKGNSTYLNIEDTNESFFL